MRFENVARLRTVVRARGERTRCAATRVRVRQQRRIGERCAIFRGHLSRSDAQIAMQEDGFAEQACCTRSRDFCTETNTERIG